MTFTVIGFLSCTKDNNLLPVSSAPLMTDVSISGEGLVYDIKVFFNEGVFANNNKTGDLTRNNFSIVILNKDIIITNYIVTHSACQKNANIRIVLNMIPTVNDTIIIQPSMSNSIYNFNGVSMCDSERLTIVIDGS